MVMAINSKILTIYRIIKTRIMCIRPIVEKLLPLKHIVINNFITFDIIRKQCLFLQTKY